MLRLQGNYKGAENAYRAYADSFPGDLRAEQGINDCLTAPSVKQTGSAYSVKLATLFNSSRSDFSPAYMGVDAQQLYFTSTRQQAKGDISSITGIKNGDIFFSKKDEKGKWKVAEAVEGDVNTENDEGACAFTQDGKRCILQCVAPILLIPEWLKFGVRSVLMPNGASLCKSRFLMTRCPRLHTPQFLLTDDGCISRRTCRVVKAV